MVGVFASISCVTPSWPKKRWTILNIRSRQSRSGLLKMQVLVASKYIACWYVWNMTLGKCPAWDFSAMFVRVIPSLVAFCIISCRIFFSARFIIEGLLVSTYKKKVQWVRHPFLAILTRWSFFCRFYLKSKVFAIKSPTINDLKENIWQAISKKTPKYANSYKTWCIAYIHCRKVPGRQSSAHYLSDVPHARFLLIKVESWPYRV